MENSKNPYHVCLDSEQQFFLTKYTQGIWKINSEGLVDIEGDFDCYVRSYTGLMNIKFGRVTGNFNCLGNKLTGLAGCPQEVGGNFFCSSNWLLSLVGAPKVVGGIFNCSGNRLNSLEGSPQEVGGDFYCQDNHLQSLAGAPEIICGKFQSDSFRFSEGQWSLKHLAQLYFESAGGENKDLLGTLVSLEALQKRIDTNQEKAAVDLKSIAGLPEYISLVWPEGLKGEVDLLTELDVIGL